MQPPVPVVAVADYVRILCLFLKRKNFHPILVFDGARNPLKAETNNTRYKDVDKELDKLETMYQSGSENNLTIPQNEVDDDDDADELREIIDEVNGRDAIVTNNDDDNNNNVTTLNETPTNNNAISTNNSSNNNKEKPIELKDIIAQQKKASIVRVDILFEVLQMAKREGIPVVGSAFEADHQLISLMNQNIIDFVLTNDGDIPFQGCSHTLMNLSRGTASCHLITRAVILEGMKEMFDSPRELDNYDLKYLACMLGNDYVDRIKGEGVVTCTKNMKEFVHQGLLSRQDWIATNHVPRMKSIEHKFRFNHSLEIWEHAPSFWIVCHDCNNTPRNAFYSKERHQYNVELRSMTGVLESNDVQFWINSDNDNENRNNLRIGFNPFTNLIVNHPTEVTVTSLDMFSMEKWSRTGKTLTGIPAIFNDEEEELCHGSVIDFNKRPPHLLPDDVLLFWLETRGANSRIDGRIQLLTAIDNACRTKMPPLPKIRIRQCCNYVSVNVLSPVGQYVNWLRGDDALKAIRNNVPAINDNRFTNVFGKRNASRTRCLRHLFSGSFDCNHIEVTYDLLDSSRPNSKLFVIQAKSAPSQKLASGDLYSLCISLEKDDNLEPPSYQILRTPFSRCDCPVGMFNCSHRGDLLLLIFIMQQRKEWTYDEFHRMMPEPIHAVAALAIPVEIVYPRKRSADAENEKVIKRRLLHLRLQLGLEEENQEIDDENNDDTVKSDRGRISRS